MPEDSSAEADETGVAARSEREAPVAAAVSPGRPDPAGRSEVRHRTVRRIAKWTWAVLVAGVAAVVLAGEWNDISAQVSEMSVGLLVTGFVLTLAAKLLLAENARLAAVRSGIPIGFETAARLYNLSQLGKYLPGSVWQFVGRAAGYRSLGAGYGPIRDALLTESLWVVGGAFVVGFAASGTTVAPVLVESLEEVQLAWVAGGLSVVLAIVVVVVVLRREAVWRSLRTAVPTPRVVLTQCAIWLLLGGSFWALARASDIEIAPFYAVGLFATAYAVGFLVLFAPAGLGVRDAILVVGLLAEADEAQALVVVVVARVWYIAAELLLAGVQGLTPRITPREQLGEPATGPPASGA